MKASDEDLQLFRQFVREHGEHVLRCLRDLYGSDPRKFVAALSDEIARQRVEIGDYRKRLLPRFDRDAKRLA